MVKRSLSKIFIKNEKENTLEGEIIFSPFKKAKKFLLLFSGLSSIIILFLLIPIIFLLTTSDIEAISQTINNKEALNSIFLSIEAGILAASISTFFSIPLAYIFSRSNFKGRSFIESLLDLPLVMPHTVAGIAILLTFNSRAPIGAFLSSIGFRIEDSLWGIVLAMMYVSAPFSINFSEQGFKNVDISLEKVARSLGAGPFKTFITVSLPLAVRSIIIGWLMSLARAISEVGAIMIVSYHPIVGSVLVYEWFTIKGLKLAASLSILLLAVSFIILAILRLLEWRK
jgi:molybdate/tungstate transport system permease protein